MTVIATKNTVVGRWTVSGIPNDGSGWLVGWIVPAAPRQPAGYGWTLNNSMADPFDLSENGVAYKVYMTIDAADGDDSFNGAKLEVH